MIDIITDDSLPTDVEELLYDVLYRGFGVSRDADWYHPAAGSVTLVARSADGELLGTARLLPAAGDAEWQVRQVAVAPHVRGTGIGRVLMLAVQRRARQEGASILMLNSRDTAIEFYERFGFECAGEAYVSELTHIPHRPMSKRLE